MSANARTIAPFAAIAVTYLVRKKVTKMYQARTGHTPPTADDVAAPIPEVLGWAVAGAVLNASIEIAFTRFANRHSRAVEISAQADAT